MMRVVGVLMLMVVLAVVAGVILWGPDGCTVEGAKLARVATDDEVLANAICTYLINAGRPPSTEQGLLALEKEPVSGPKPRRWVQIMKKVPTDPWGNPYGYRVLTEGTGNWSFELSSAGKDGIVGTEDDWAKVIDWR